MDWKSELAMQVGFWVIGGVGVLSITVMSLLIKDKLSGKKANGGSPAMKPSDVKQIVDGLGKVETALKDNGNVLKEHLSGISVRLERIETTGNHSATQLNSLYEMHDVRDPDDNSYRWWNKRNVEKLIKRIASKLGVADA